MKSAGASPHHACAARIDSNLTGLRVYVCDTVTFFLSETGVWQRLSCTELVVSRVRSLKQPPCSAAFLPYL